MIVHRINDAKKINVHGPDWPERPGYLGARRPASDHNRRGIIGRMDIEQSMEVLTL